MQISEQGLKKLNELIFQAEGKYAQAARLTAKHGFDQDGRGMGIYYREQLATEAHLNNLKDIRKKVSEVLKAKKAIVGVGMIVELEINNKRQKFYVDGFKYENSPAILTLESPIGKAIKGLRAGDETDYKIGDNLNTVKILEISL